MATVIPPRANNQRDKRVWHRRAAWLTIIVLAAGLAVYWRPLRATALTGAAVGARVACSCRYVAGRSLSDCRNDFEPGMGLILLSEDAAHKSITARFPLLARQTAAFHEGMGCVLQPWEN